MINIQNIALTDKLCVRSIFKNLFINCTNTKIKLTFALQNKF